ncbi:MAG: 2OG-Fe(II) oxygenase, partial [Proteobacteria bacterium]|nr:2OG-Fe(II) oxygenase [Pseudomonadota bacterium]
MSETIQLKSTYEGAEVYATDPLVAVRSNVISPIECAYLIELAKPHIKRAGVVLDDGYKPSDGRTGSNHWLRFDEDDVVHSIGKRIADIVGLPLENAESMQIIHYGPEQEYRPHFDAFNLTLPRGQKAAQWGGQRLVTALVYLNKVAGGGATQFPKLGITVPASPGRMVIFHNTTTDISGPHPLSLHAGMPVEAGEKWAFNLWFRLHDTRESFDAAKALPSVVFGSSSSNPAINQAQVTQAPDTVK